MKDLACVAKKNFFTNTLPQRQNLNALPNLRFPSSFFEGLLQCHSSHPSLNKKIQGLLKDFQGHISMFLNIL